MRRAIVGVLSALLGVLGLGAVFTMTASSATAVEVCYEVVSDLGGVRVVCYDDGGGGGGSENGGGSGGGGGGGSEECRWSVTGEVIPCSTDAGYWTGGCYAKVADPQPPFEHPAWGGRTEGTIIACSNPVGSMVTATVFYWSASAPTPAIDPAALARQAVSQMDLEMGEIGATPPIGGDPSLVGLPIWLWVTNPADNTTGPITRAAADGGVTVTATATLDRIEYVLRTDRRVLDLSCAGPSAAGTAFTAGMGGQNSPTCGWTGAQNNLTGIGTLTGTAYWTVQWTGGGQTGTIVVPPQARSVPFEISELQVIRTDGK